jgi:hypothetical protein
MKVGLKTRTGSHSIRILTLMIFITIATLVGCQATTKDTYKKGMEPLADKEYFLPKKPVDRHYIGYAWSKQFGPVEDPSAPDIRIKVEKSFNTLQQQFAYNLGLSFGGVSSKGPTVQAGAEGGKGRTSQLEDVKIISPVSLADIPFELNIPYVTEALRLENFVLKGEAGIQAGVTAQVGTFQAGAKGQSKSDSGLTGEGLVVAYKLHMIDSRTYVKQDSGSIALELDKPVDFPKANVFVKSQLRVIEAGSSQPLARNLLWSCDRANAKSKDIVAAWIIEIRPKDPKRKSLSIAFPAFPKIEDCQSFSDVIYSRIDPLTDKIIRQKINITIFEDELSDSFKPLKWKANVSLINESFNIMLVKQGDLEKLSETLKSKGVSK